jgi:protein phosphatase inhibitor 2
MNKPRKTGRSGSGAGAKMADIPGLDLGEPQLEPDALDEGAAERKVHVDSGYMDVDGARHGEEVTADMTSEEREKHKKFEEMRKKHYEMKNIKDLLGYVECDV